MFADENDYDDGHGGPTWQMEDITGGTLFSETYQVATVEKLPSGLRPTVEFGNKIVMPASALDTLSRLNIMYPMMFRVSSDDDEPTRSTFCGVLEFSAPEGVVFLPPWMLHTLRLHAGDLVVLSNVALPLGTFIRIQPQSVAFLDITDPRAVLEHSLRNFACLTVGDRVAICYNECIYELLVQEVRPDDGRGGICVLETDLQVDFSPPLGYEEPKGRSGATLSGTTTADTGTGVGIGIGSRGGGGEKSIASSLDLTGSVLSTSATTNSTLSSTAVPTGTGGPPSLSSSFSAFSGPANRLSNRAKTLGGNSTEIPPSSASSLPSLSSSTAANAKTGSASPSLPIRPMQPSVRPNPQQSAAPSQSSPLSPVPISLPRGTLFFGGIPSESTVANKRGESTLTPTVGGPSITGKASGSAPSSSSPSPAVGSTTTEPKFTAFSGKANRLQ